MKKFSEIQTNWLKEGNSLKREFQFDNFKDSIDFVNKVAEISDDLNHHPYITINYNKVLIETTTHDEGNIITEKDYQLCRHIDKIF